MAVGRYICLGQIGDELELSDFCHDTITHKDITMLETAYGATFLRKSEDRVFLEKHKASECFEGKVSHEIKNPVKGYHLKVIEKGELGELSKIKEELEEAIDSEEQGIRIMSLVELSDLYGALEAHMDKHYQPFTMVDLKAMSDVTKRAFENGGRV